MDNRGCFGLIVVLSILFGIGNYPTFTKCLLVFLIFLIFLGIYSSLKRKVNAKRKKLTQKELDELTEFVLRQKNQPKLDIITPLKPIVKTEIKEEGFFESLKVISVRQKGDKFTCVLKRENNTYAYVERASSPYVLNSIIKRKKEESDRFNWFSHDYYVMSGFNEGEQYNNDELNSETNFMILFFDTETTGLPNNYNAPISDSNNWPRLVQLAFILCDDTGKIFSEGNYIVKPSGFVIPSEAFSIHGISTERANSEGENLDIVLGYFNEVLNKANVVVAHNIDFDKKIIGAELFRLGIVNSLDIKHEICTMKLSTDFCKINSTRGYKFPKLSELHFKLFGIQFNEAHNALIDVKATFKCFWQLIKLQVISLPEITKKGISPILKAKEEKNESLNSRVKEGSIPVSKILNFIDLLESGWDEIQNIEIKKNENINENLNPDKAVLKCEISLDKFNNFGQRVEREFIVDPDVNVLKLQMKGITKLPKEIGDFTNLVTLDLYSNFLENLPKEIGQLINLTYLSLFKNPIIELPKEIGELINLTSLNFSQNQLKELPKEIGQLTKLTFLNLSSNRLKKLPKEIFNLSMLENLFLSKNDFGENEKKEIINLLPNCNIHF